MPINTLESMPNCDTSGFKANMKKKINGIIPITRDFKLMATSILVEITERFLYDL